MKQRRGYDQLVGVDIVGTSLHGPKRVPGGQARVMIWAPRFTRSQ
jgi:hypothetical protein